MKQIARYVTTDGDGTLRDCRYLLHDRDTKFTRSFRSIALHLVGSNRCILDLPSATDVALLSQSLFMRRRRHPSVFLSPALAPAWVGFFSGQRRCLECHCINSRTELLIEITLK
jgi:hypothetical protein